MRSAKGLIDFIQVWQLKLVCDIANVAKGIPFPHSQQDIFTIREKLIEENEPEEKFFLDTTAVLHPMLSASL